MTAVAQALLDEIRRERELSEISYFDAMARAQKREMAREMECDWNEGLLDDPIEPEYEQIQQPQRQQPIRQVSDTPPSIQSDAPTRAKTAKAKRRASRRTRRTANDARRRQSRISLRLRFEVLKRDEFTCQYCGRCSPDVVLEVDHISPKNPRGEFEPGSDDPINLITSCWDCNHGKANVPLERLVVGQDPHDAAVAILERQRQVEEYNRVLESVRVVTEENARRLWRYWQGLRGHRSDYALNNIPPSYFGWLKNALTYCPFEQIRSFIELAVDRKAEAFSYVVACVRNWRERQTASTSADVDETPSQE